MTKRFLLLGLVGLLVGALSVSASQVTLCWNPPTQNVDGSPLAGLAGYRVYYGVDGAPFATCLNVGLSLQASITGLTQGIPYHFVVTAYSPVAESALSPSVTWTASTGVSTNAVPSPVLTGMNCAVNGGVTVSWSSVAGQVYTVQRTFCLTDPFQPCASDIPATPPCNTYCDVLPGNTNNAAFYRVSVTASE